MGQATTRYELLVWSNGWIEIRDGENSDQWIATDRPMEVLP